MAIESKYVGPFIDLCWEIFGRMTAIRVIVMVILLIAASGFYAAVGEVQQPGFPPERPDADPAFVAGAAVGTFLIPTVEAVCAVLLLVLGGPRRIVHITAKP